jgi:hypothetical protein
MKALTIVLCSSIALLAGCSSAPKTPRAASAPQPAVPLSLLDRADPPDSVPNPGQPQTLSLPGDYELIWQANATGGQGGHWVIRRVAQNRDGVARIRTGEATRHDADPLQPAYIDQELARMIATLQQTNMAQAYQLNQLTTELQRMRATADATASKVLQLTGKAAERELQLRQGQGQKPAAGSGATQAPVR